MRCQVTPTETEWEWAAHLECRGCSVSVAAGAAAEVRPVRPGATTGLVHQFLLPELPRQGHYGLCLFERAGVMEWLLWCVLCGVWGIGCGAVWCGVEWSGGVVGGGLGTEGREEREIETFGVRLADAACQTDNLNPNAGHRSIARDCRENLKSTVRDCRENVKNFVRDCME